MRRLLLSALLASSLALPPGQNVNFLDTSTFFGEL